jgi:cytochrome c-type biogenesis protein
MTFAFGWTPCVGPILGSVLALAATEGGVTHGIELLFVYSLGIGVPFVLTGFAVGGFVRLLRRFGRLVHGLEIAAGVFLMVMGVFIFTDHLDLVAGWLPLFNRFAR